MLRQSFLKDPQSQKLEKRQHDLWVFSFFCTFLAHILPILYNLFEVNLMPSVNVTIRMDKNDKEQLEQLLSDFGFTMNTEFIFC